MIKGDIMNKLEFLVSTMDLDSYNLHKQMNIDKNVLVINQSNKMHTNFEDKKKGIKYINVNERGLSKSRNLAIRESAGDICIISDDDVKYIDKAEEIIINEHLINREADLIVFQVERINGREKRFHNEKEKLNFFKALKVSSVEITFKRKSIIEKNIKFNELLGAGADFFMGEENDFMIQCLKHKLVIQYVPIKIAEVDMSDSSWFEDFNEKYFYSRGASYASMFPRLYPIMLAQFFIRKRKLMNIQFKDVFKCYLWSLKGSFKYKKIANKE